MRRLERDNLGKRSTTPKHTFSEQYHLPTRFPKSHLHRSCVREASKESTQNQEGTQAFANYLKALPQIGTQILQLSARSPG